VRQIKSLCAWAEVVAAGRRSLLAVALASQGCQCFAAEPAVWLSTLAPVDDPKNHFQMNGPVDYMELFVNGAPWTSAARRTAVFKTSTQFIDHASDEQIRAMVLGLQARGILLGLEALMLVPTDRCGRGIEGYGYRGVMDRIAQRILKAGGVLSFVAFDEPVWYAHWRQGPGLCHDSIEKLAEAMVEPVHALATAFPLLEFGTIEPLNNGTNQEFLDDVLRFSKEFQRQTGAILSFIHADLIWQDNWLPQLTSWRDRIHNAGMQIGVVVDGDPTDKTDIEWAVRAVGRARALMSDSRIAPDQYIFQSWGSHPGRLLPEDNEGTMTWIINKALESTIK